MSLLVLLLISGLEVFDPTEELAFNNPVGALSICMLDDVSPQEHRATPEATALEGEWVLVEGVLHQLIDADVLLTAGLTSHGAVGT